jgi:hypothetical protein
MLAVQPPQTATGLDLVAAFEARCWARSRLYADGEISLHDAVDKLQADAVSSGLVELIGQDRVQSIMADAFGPATERERILCPATAPADPHSHWLTAMMPCLGLDQLSDPISYFRGAVLPVHRTVLGWIKASFHGIVPADTNLLWAALNELPELNDGDHYLLGAEDLAHAEELEADLSPLPDHVRILVPIRGDA